MKTSQIGIDLIKRNEGCELVAYQDSKGVWTIGFGDTGPDVRAGLKISQEEAERRLADRLAREFEPGVRAAIGNYPTTQNQFDAMVSLAYNIGVGAFGRSTVVNRHKAGDYLSAATAFALWNKAGEQVLRGLTRRRAEESALYLHKELVIPTNVPALKHLTDFTQTARALQQDLKDQGFYRGVVDGDWGPISRAALDAWHRKNPTAYD